MCAPTLSTSAIDAGPLFCARLVVRLLAGSNCCHGQLQAAAVEHARQPGARLASFALVRVVGAGSAATAG